MTDRRTRLDVAQLWVSAYQELADRAAHEMRNALNGVAVNVEVVRSRLARQNVDPGAVSPFAANAANGMEELSAFSEAFLTLARSPRQPADVAPVLSAIFTVLEPVARRTMDDVRLRAPRNGEGITSAPADTARLVLLATALAGIRTNGSVVCSVEQGAGRFDLLFAGWFPLQLPDAIVSVARGANILLDENRSDGVIWTFPAYSG